MPLSGLSQNWTYNDVGGLFLTVKLSNFMKYGHIPIKPPRLPGTANPNSSLLYAFENLNGSLVSIFGSCDIGLDASSGQ